MDKPGSPVRLSTAEDPISFRAWRHLQSTSFDGLAFNALGNDNTVTAVGPLAIAGTLGTNGLNGANRVIRTTPGLNINGNAFP